MSKTNIKTLTRQISYAFIAAVMVLSYFPTIASASPITARKVVLGSSAANATTTYDFTFTIPSTTDVQGMTFEACANASGTCGTTPAAFTSVGSSVGAITGIGSGGTWVNDTSVAGKLAVHNATNSGTDPGEVTVSFSSVHNPSAANATFYIWITTYATYSGSYLSPIDTGTVAASTAGQVTVNASVDETLTFTLASQTVSLGDGASMTTGAASTDTSTMSAATNASSGYTISYSGATLSGPTTITAIGAAKAASNPGNKQFGINLAANTAPSVTGSAAPSGGSGAATVGVYDTANEFAFDTAGDDIASAAGPTNTTTYVVSYMANIDGSTPAGAYSTTITYTATANF